MLTVSYSISHQKDPRAPTAITSTDETDEAWAAGDYEHVRFPNRSKTTEKTVTSITKNTPNSFLTWWQNRMLVIPSKPMGHRLWEFPNLLIVCSVYMLNTTAAPPPGWCR